MSDILAGAAEPHCPTCGTVLHEHPRGWWCRGCDVEWPAGVVIPGDGQLPGGLDRL